MLIRQHFKDGAIFGETFSKCLSFSDVSKESITVGVLNSCVRLPPYNPPYYSDLMKQSCSLSG